MTTEQLQRGHALNNDINSAKNNLKHIDDAIIAFKSGRKNGNDYWDTTFQIIKYNELTIHVEEEQLTDILLTLKTQWEDKLIKLQEEFKAL